MSTTRLFLIIFAAVIGIYIGIRIHRARLNELVQRRGFQDGSSRLVSYSQKKSYRRRVKMPLVLHRKYLAEYSTTIDGWFIYEILYVIWTISQYQYDTLGIAGGIGEIGVHHGKLTCYLYLMQRYREQILFAVDVFENQKLNKDLSGKGNKDIFLKNIETYAGVTSNRVVTYAGSSLDLNPVFSNDSAAFDWWKSEVVGKEGLQIISIDGGHTTLLTYSDLCLASNSVMDGGVVIVDDITHSGWLGVRDGVGRFLAETSSPNLNEALELKMAESLNTTTFQLSKRIVEATNPRQPLTNGCSRLVPFLQIFNKLFLTTPNFYPHYMMMLMKPDNFANDMRSSGIIYLEYQAYRLTLGHVPIWTENTQVSNSKLTEIFQTYIEKKWSFDIDSSKHHQ